MDAVNNSIWTKLEKDQLSAGRFATSLVFANSITRLLAGVDSYHQRNYLLVVSAQSVEYKDKSTRGLTVDTVELALDTSGSERFLIITCKQQTGYEAFNMIGNDIALMMQNTQKEPVQLISGIIAKWKNFWSNIPESVLSREALVGLFGELYFLNSWLLPDLGVNSIYIWKGPRGSRHDFEAPSWSVEVKTTTSGRGRIHHINGLDQLDSPQNGPLYFFSLRIREEGGASNNLTVLVNSIYHQLASYPEYIDDFEKILVASKYNPVHADYYLQHSFRILEETLFSVKPDFPRITKTDFPAGINPAIERVDYVINLNTFDYLCLAKFPEQANSILTL